MYKTHRDLTEPDITHKIWHYYSLPKFLSLLHTSSFYLCRHDRYGDSYEGKLSFMDRKFFDEKSSGILKGKEDDSFGCSFSICWTKSEVDEYVLWNSYSSLKEGVAVQSSVGRLIEALDPKDSRNIFVSEVNYIDYDNEYTFSTTKGFANLLGAHFTKRKYFEAEKEVRALYFDPYARFNTSPEGLLYKVDLNTLIESIYVAPASMMGYSDVLQEILGFYGLSHIKVSKSSI